MFFSYADPGRGGEGNDEESDPYEILKSNLDAAYEGNRAPIPFYIHVFWFNGVGVEKDLCFSFRPSFRQALFFFKIIKMFFCAGT